VIIVYDSMTGQTKKFALRIGYPAYAINEYDQTFIEPVLFITRSINFGEVTKTASEFLSLYHDRVIGVAVSGNRNWGANFGAAGDKIAKQYHIPLVLKFEASGFDQDVKIIKDWIQNYSMKK
jgi:protein involved in ribonucleotide reduction